MKSETEIRKHMNDLLAIIQNLRPCKCGRDGHAFECMIGGYMQQANAAILAWVLDENPGMDRAVEICAMEARR